MATVLLTTLLAVIVCVMIHYEALIVLTRMPARLRAFRRGGVLVGVLGALVAHLIETMVFAGAYMFLIARGLGSIQCELTFKNAWYYSLITYTTVGFGDVTPSGPLRFLTGVEALAGLVLVTWTASFLFIQMQRHWEGGRSRNDGSGDENSEDRSQND